MLHSASSLITPEQHSVVQISILMHFCSNFIIDNRAEASLQQPMYWWEFCGTSAPYTTFFADEVVSLDKNNIIFFSEAQEQNSFGW